MPLGFSMGEILVTVGVVAVAFGPKVPIIARGLGRLTGQAVGAPRATRDWSIPSARSLDAPRPRREPSLILSFPSHPRVRRSDERQRR